MGEFGVLSARIQWVTAHALAMGVVVPVVGWAADRLGPKRWYVLSSGILTAAVSGLWGRLSQPLVRATLGLDAAL
jgi:MFS family permease